MNITFVLPALNLGGGTRVIAIFAEALQRRGHSVDVVYWAPQKPTLIQRFKIFLKTGRLSFASVQRSHFDEVNVPTRQVKTYGRLGNSELSDADVVIATWWETAAPVAALPREKGAKAYFMQDYGAPGQTLEQIGPTWSLPMHFITIAKWLEELIKAENPTAKVTVVPNAVDSKKFNSSLRGKQARPTVGFIYRSMETKGCDIALEAISLAQRKVPQLHVRVISDQSPPPELPDFVTYEREVDDQRLREVYASCDAWIFPSRREGYGLPISEAMACRTPVIATPAGAAPELVPGAGILLAAPDAVEMARAIEAIAVMSPKDWQELSDASRRKVERYSWEEATDLFEAALHQACTEAS